ncbi:MAG: hypothetical protein ACREAM_26910 [Blastocatellia bacterium]
MRVRRKLSPVRKGAKRFLDRCGEQLVCVRYHYYQQRRKRFTTVEIIVEESGWFPPERPAIVGLRVDFQETELQRRVKQAGGKWNSAKRVWEIHYDQAMALGLKKRIVKLEVSDIRHHQVSNTRHS